MPYACEAFSTLGEVVVMDGRAITANDVAGADILAIRSTTNVDRNLLDGSSVKFVGTATIGTDHLDIDYLDKAGIKWCYAPGCNANSVSEYVTAALLCLANRYFLTLEGKIIGVIGVGNVGSFVVKKARTLGMDVLQNDPPRERQEKSSVISHQSSGFSPSLFVCLDRVLEEADIVTLHVPLTMEGPDATFHMANEAFFTKMKPGCIFLNTARGAVVETDALLMALGKRIVSHAIVDTWEGEPAYRKDLLERIDIGTPHIAGHSFEGKVMGTVMVYRETCRFLGVEPAWTPDELLPPPLVPELKIDAGRRRDEEVLWDIVRKVYDIEADDHHLRQEQKDMDHAAYFDHLRRNYPVRREFRFTRVILKNATASLEKKVSGLGFGAVHGLKLEIGN